MESRILTDLRYEDKAWHQAAADTLLFPVRELFGGKHVECVRISDDAVLFRGPNHLKSKNFLRVIAEKISLLALTVLTSPLVLIGALVKSIGNARGRELYSRFHNAESRENINSDKFEERDILEDSNYFCFVEKIAGFMEYDPIRQHAHLHADKVMSSFRSGQVCDKVSRFPGKYLEDDQGGLFFISAKNIKRYVDELLEMSPEDPDLKKAKKLVDEYYKWSLRMVPLMLPRLVGANLDGYVHEMVLDLKKRIESLDQGESFFVPVNLRMKDGGFHTISIEIGREGDKCFFKVHNVGAGADKHKRNGFGVRAGIYPFSVENISREEITDNKFLERLVDEATFREYSSNCCTRFYGFLRETFSSDKGHVINREGANPKKNLQYSGTCIFKSPTAALKSSLGEKAYKQVMFKIKLMDWFKLYESYIEPEESDSSDEVEKGHILAHIAFHNLEKNIKKQAERENLSEDRLKEKYFSEKQMLAFDAMCNMH